MPSLEIDIMAPLPTQLQDITPRADGTHKIILQFLRAMSATPDQLHTNQPKNEKFTLILTLFMLQQ